jgi:hypothetical protein
MFVWSLAVSGTNIFAGTDSSGVFLSSDNGENWYPSNNGLMNKEVLALAPSNSNMFAGTWGGGIFLSSNNGTSWSAINSQPLKTI